MENTTIHRPMLIIVIMIYLSFKMKLAIQARACYAYMELYNALRDTQRATRWD